MTPAQVRGLLRDLLLWRQAQGPDDTPGGQIADVTPEGDSLAVTFTDGTRVLLMVIIRDPS